MILVDTSVWIDHLHRSDPLLVELLGRWSVIRHPMVVGELALGTLKNRRAVLDALGGLPVVTAASHEEVAVFVEAHALWGKGLSLVDAHLLASALLSPGTLLWTRDRRLRSAADTLGVNYI